MPVGYSQPEGALQRELEEVAQSALAVTAALSVGLNAKIPPDFPTNQLLDICKSLAELPLGTSEGCRGALEYARNSLPAIRRKHVHIEEASRDKETSEPESKITRDSALDARLRDLIASTTTALDEYRHTAAVQLRDDEAPETPVAVDPEMVRTGIEQSSALEASLSTAKKMVEETAIPSSAKADNLKRQLNDGKGLNRLARAELKMPTVTISWYRHLLDALKAMPTILRQTANGLKVGADIFEIAADRWHDFEKNLMGATINEFRKACDSFTQIADVLDAAMSKRPDAKIEPGVSTRILESAVTHDSVYGYTRAKFPHLPVSDQWTEAMLRDLNHERYRTIRDIDREVDYARAAVKEFANSSPDLFKSGTDWITKSLIFTDSEFRDVHSVSASTRKAAIRAGISRN